MQAAQKQGNGPLTEDHTSEIITSLIALDKCIDIVYRVGHTQSNVEGILPKGPYLPCVSPFGRIPSMYGFPITYWPLDDQNAIRRNYLYCFTDWYLHIFLLWWCHQMETFSALLAICAGNSLVPSEFPAQRPVTRSFDVFFDLCLNKRSSKQSWGWWFETLSPPLWRHCNVK